jgi:hypothetical protein
MSDASHRFDVFAIERTTRLDDRVNAGSTSRASHSRQPQSLMRQGSQSSDTTQSKHIAKSSKSLDQDRFTHVSTDVASSFTHEAHSQVLYAGSNVESKSQENENFHEQTLLTLMKRWYKPI